MDAHLEVEMSMCHNNHPWVWAVMLRGATEDRYRAVLDRAMYTDGRCSSALEEEVVVGFVGQGLRVSMVVGPYQEGVVGVEEAPGLTEVEEGHFVAVEISPEALWQRCREEWPESPICWTSICVYMSAYLELKNVISLSLTSQNSAHPTRYGW